MTSVRVFDGGMKPGTSEKRSPVRVKKSHSLQFDDAALETNHGGMGSVASTKLRQNGLYATLYRLFGD